MKFETLAIHAGHAPDSATGAVREPLHLSTTFERGADGTYPHGYDYTRSGNPNRTSLERAITALERGKDAIAFASGSAATLAVFALAAPGGRIVCAADCYYGTGRQLREIVPRWGVDVEFVDVTSLTEVSQALAAPTSLLWIETPSNPLLRVADIAALVNLAHDRGALVGVDNTFASPVLQQPLALGADFVMHSTTKYLGGHSDVLGGIVVTRDAGAECAALRAYQTTAGSVPSPFDCWLLLRSLPTLPLRVRAQAANALAIARFLHADKRVEIVHYAGLPDHPGHEIALRQMTGGFGLGNADQRTQKIIILWPVDQGDVAGESSGPEFHFIHNAAVKPEVQFSRNGPAFRVESEFPGCQIRGIGIGKVQQFPGPWRVYGRNVVAPEHIFPRFLDDMVFPRKVVHGRKDGKGLVVLRVGLLRSVQFAGILL